VLGGFASIFRVERQSRLVQHHVPLQLLHLPLVQRVVFVLRGLDELDLFVLAIHLLRL